MISIRFARDDPRMVAAQAQAAAIAGSSRNWQQGSLDNKVRGKLAEYAAAQALGLDPSVVDVKVGGGAAGGGSYIGVDLPAVPGYPQGLGVKAVQKDGPYSGHVLFRHTELSLDDRTRQPAVIVKVWEYGTGIDALVEGILPAGTQCSQEGVIEKLRSAGFRQCPYDASSLLPLPLVAGGDEFDF